MSGEPGGAPTALGLQLLGTNLGKHVFRLNGLPPGAAPEVAEVTMIGVNRPASLGPGFFAGRYRREPAEAFLVTTPPAGCVTFFHLRGPEGVDAVLALDPAAGGIVPVSGAG